MDTKQIKIHEVKTQLFVYFFFIQFYLGNFCVCVYSMHNNNFNSFSVLMGIKQRKNKTGTIQRLVFIFILFYLVSLEQFQSLPSICQKKKMQYLDYWICSSHT